MDFRSFRGRKVFITGHTGFKGSWLALWLADLGAEVYGYSLPPPTNPSNFETSRVREALLGHAEADILDREALAKAVKAARPDFVFHLAAQSLVRESYATPYETFEVNVMGSASLLEAVRAYGGPCAVVMVTSDKCYENLERQEGYSEGDRMGGFDPYSASKGAAELFISSYRRSFFNPEKLQSHGVKVASARAGNVIGGGDWAKDRIVVDFAVHCSRGESVPVRSPHSVRPWQHVLEPIGGYLALAQKLDQSADPALCDGFNFGPRLGDEATVRALVERFCARWPGASWRDDSKGEHPHEAGLLRLKIDKAVSMLGWSPVWGLDKTVERTANWYRAFYGGQTDTRALCLEDIQSYSADMAGSGN